MRVLRQRPGVEHEGPEAREPERSVRHHLVTDRMLHEGVGRDDEIAGEPTADEEGERGGEMTPAAEPAFAEDQEPEKRRLEEEREQAFHGERLTDDASRVARECRPVRPELELHRHTGHHAYREVETEDSDPETGGVVPPRISSPETSGLEHDDEQRQAHRELWEEIVVDDREGKLEPMPEQRIGHERPRTPMPYFGRSALISSDW